MNSLLAQAVESTPMTDGIPWIDKVGAVLLVMFGILGFWRGLWWQVIRLAGFIGAFAAARFFSPQAEPMITETFNITDPRFSQGMAWLVIFIAALIAVVLLGKLGKSMLDAMQLGLVDRLGGALAGAVTAILIHSAFLAVLSLFAQADWLNEQLVGSWSDSLFTKVAEEYPVIVDKQQSIWIGSELRKSGLRLQVPLVK